MSARDKKPLPPLLSPIEALQALGCIGDGYCFCSRDRDPDKSAHEPECADARAALNEQEPIACIHAERAAPLSSLDQLQVGGDHYKKHRFTPWHVIDEYGLGFYDGNALKYVLRAKEKGGTDDLRKARHYLDKLIELHEKYGGAKP